MASFLVVLSLKRPESPFSLTLPGRLKFFPYGTVYEAKGLEASKVSNRYLAWLKLLTIIPIGIYIICAIGI